ncbi:MAG TPA: hypothetical protein VKA65_15715 [Acidimicrobiales bacterium]|nr:hypothetical protein [Acidimicrobiales bacterium]
MAAALLNASALGAGYVYLRRWRDAAVYWAGLVAWLLLASSTAFWLVALVAWVGAAVVRGFLLGRPPAAHLAPAGARGPTSSWSPPSHQAGPGPTPSPVDAPAAPHQQPLGQGPTPPPPRTATGGIPLPAAPSGTADPARTSPVVGTASVATAPSPMTTMTTSDTPDPALTTEGAGTVPTADATGGLDAGPPTRADSAGSVDTASSAPTAAAEGGGGTESPPTTAPTDTEDTTSPPTTAEATDTADTTGPATTPEATDTADTTSPAAVGEPDGAADTGSPTTSADAGEPAEPADSATTAEPAGTADTATSATSGDTDATAGTAIPLGSTGAAGPTETASPGDPMPPPDAGSVAAATAAAWMAGDDTIPPAPAFGPPAADGARIQPPPRVGSGAEDARRAAPFAVALVLLVVVGAVVVSYRDRAYDALREGDGLHADGQCAKAVEQYDDVASYDKSFTAALDRASEQGAVCEQLLTARQQAGEDDYEDAIETYTAYAERDRDEALFRDGARDELATVRSAYAADLGDDGGAADRDVAEAYEQYVTIADEHPGTPEAEAAPGEFRTLYREATAEYADRRWCNAIDDLEAFAEIRYRAPITDPVASAAPKELRGALTECGLARLDDGDIDAAEPYLQRVVDEFPATASALRARRGLDRITAERERIRIRDEIAGVGDSATELPPPVAAGSSGSGSARLQIVNGSRESVEILYDGPETGLIELPACGNCTDFGPNEVVTSCGTPDSPATDAELAPGTYSVVVRSTGDSFVRPFSGTWPLSGGTLYADCYYLQAVSPLDPATG